MVIDREMDPEVGRRIDLAAVKDGICGDQDQMFLLQGNDTPLIPQFAAWPVVVIEPPKRGLSTPAWFQSVICER